jgi:TPR repeat protein
MPLNLSNALSKSICEERIDTFKVLDEAANGNPDAQYVLGIIYYKNGDFKEAFEWFSSAALNNHAASQLNVGCMYENGEGVKTDKEEAVRWYRKAAEQGYVHGQYFLATVYYEGIYTEQDYEKVFEWFSKAAEQNHSRSLFALGEMYINGVHIAKNKQEALRLFTLSALHGKQDAEEILGSKIYGEIPVLFMAVLHGNISAIEFLMKNGSSTNDRLKIVGLVRKF